MDFDRDAELIVDGIDWIVTDPAAVKKTIAAWLRDAYEDGRRAGANEPCPSDL